MALRSSIPDVAPKTTPALYSNFSLQRLVEVAASQKSLCEQTINLQWLKNYCKAKKLALFLPLQPHVNINESIEKKGQYYSDLLNGLYHFHEALDIKKEMNNPAYRSEPQNLTQELKTMRALYTDHLVRADALMNYTASFQLILDLAFEGMQDKSTTEAVEKFKDAIKYNFGKLEGIGVIGEIFKSHLYYLFAKFLNNKLHAPEKNSTTLFKSAPLSKDEVAAFRNNCLANAYKALNDFDESMKGIGLYTLDPFTIESALLYWGENRPHADIKDVVACRRRQIDELSQACQVTVKSARK